MRAVQHAYRVLSWMENYTEDEMPPAWMWEFDDLLDDHFERVRDDRGLGLNDKGKDDDVEVTQNELTAGLRDQLRKA